VTHIVADQALGCTLFVIPCDRGIHFRMASNDKTGEAFRIVLLSRSTGYPIQRGQVVGSFLKTPDCEFVFEWNRATDNVPGGLIRMRRNCTA
jgi:hypothetical protein